MAKMLAFVALFDGAEWCDLIHGENRGKAKYRFMRVNPVGYDPDLWNEIRLRRLPGQDDKPFTYENARAAGFQYNYGEDDNIDGEFLPPEEFTSSCDCEICEKERKVKHV
jgi:hypothetical protein